MRQLFAFAILLLAAGIYSPAARADNPLRKVSGEYTFFAESRHSRDQARQIALDEARVAALAAEFGTSISQATYQTDRVSGDKEDVYFNQLSLCEVNGEWIADEGKPVFEESVGDDGNLIVRCIVKGTARRISNEAPQFEALVLRNGNEKRFADTRFRPNDELKLHVRTSVDGYLLVYLVDDEQNVFSILPYSESGDGYVKVKRDTDYVFFDNAKADPVFGEPDELIITMDSDKVSELDQCYILFSPDPFTKAVDRAGFAEIPRSIDYADFQKWLVATRKRDPKMGMKVVRISISNKI